MKTWRPVAAGILSIVTGAFTIWFSCGAIVLHERNLVGLVLGIAIGVAAVGGGILALQRKYWGLSVAGAACAIYPAHPWGSLTWTPALGVLAVVFLTLSRNEFSGRGIVSRPSEHPPTTTTPPPHEESASDQHG